MDRGELPPDPDIELALNLLAAPLYWRRSVRDAPIEPDYLDSLTGNTAACPATPTGHAAVTSLRRPTCGPPDPAPR
ncbi:TetR/AcrR family transcriptional regulator C-terminal ligand-binding domain-containing protein [Nocardia gipuzkoensis]